MTLPELFEHVLTLETRQFFNRYRQCKVTQYRYSCSCRQTQKWRESEEKARIDRDKHGISGQLSIPL